MVQWEALNRICHCLLRILDLNSTNMCIRTHCILLIAAVSDVLDDSYSHPVTRSISAMAWAPSKSPFGCVSIWVLQKFSRSYPNMRSKSMKNHVFLMTRAPSFGVVSVHMSLQEKLKHPSCVASLQLCHLAASSQSLLCSSTHWWPWRKQWWRWIITEQ